MKRATLVIATVLLLTATLIAQPIGSVQGTVTLRDGSPVPGAFVHLSGVNGGHPGHHMNLRAVSAENGTFAFDHVIAGAYTISARKPMIGFGAALIEVLPTQPTIVTLTLIGQNHDTTRPVRDSLTTVELSGTAIVLHPDTAHPRRTVYFLDVEGDGTPEYHLCFGPPWYNPPSGAERPVNGQDIMIEGGLFSYGDPPMVIVFQIDGLEWRPPFGHHGGNGGGQPYVMNLCGGAAVESDVDGHADPTRIEMMGQLDFHTCIPEPVNPPGVFMFLPQNSGGEHVFLNFGTDMTEIPGEIGHPMHIVGALIPPTPNSPPWIIVYEYNGQFWREPGDTTNLIMTVSAVDEPTLVGEPVSYLMAENYPNPFNPSTMIRYSIPAAGKVGLFVYDITGREVAELVNTYQTAGTYAVPFNGSDLSSGIYFYRITVNQQTFTNRMVLMK
ncbi:T9SS C-terminal target domain-containing protein [candidate division KSB1 bacterium]|nr:MAG: T9SS C-terminal target domain-containing protein [candidate division KSB1 bacterium]